MAGLFVTSGRRCLQLSQFQGVVSEAYMWNFSKLFIRSARNNLRKTLPINHTSTEVHGEILEQSRTNLTDSDTVISSKNNEHEPVGANQFSEMSDSDGIPPFIKLQNNDTLLSKVMIAVNSKKNRKNRTEILLEGNRLISEAIKFGVVPKHVFFSRIEDVKKISWPVVDIKMYKVPYRTLQIWSSVKTSPGVIAIFKKPNINTLKKKGKFLPLLIVCDNIRDPGNLGSILRVAAGVDCHGILLTKGCVDLWDPKVLRSGAGAHFVLPVQQDCEWAEIFGKYVDEETTVVLADNRSSTSDGSQNEVSTRLHYDLPLEEYQMVDYSSVWERNSKILLILGGETEGLSEEACKLAKTMGGIRVHIPLKNEVESLNASTAFGVIAFEIRRQFEELCTKMVGLPNQKTV